MMNRRDFMKLSAASAVTMGAVAGMAPASFAENAGVHTDAEVQAMVAEELRLSREVAFYPAAFRGDFDKFYVLFHKLSRAQYEKVDGAAAPGINASHYDMCVALTNARKALRQIKDPKSTVWEIWGDQMAVESPLPTNWENCYDNEGFRPFLNPYLLRDQGKVKGNVIIIAGGGSTHRNNVVEGYPVAEFFNKNGYNAFVLQRRVNPYAAVDQRLDLARAIRYIRHNASEKHIGKTDIMIAVGFSAGGMNVMQVVADQFGTTNTPDKVYPSYVCDAECGDPHLRTVRHRSGLHEESQPAPGLWCCGAEGRPERYDAALSAGVREYLQGFQLLSGTRCAPRCGLGHWHQGLCGLLHPDRPVAGYGGELHREPSGSGGKENRYGLRGLCMVSCRGS